MSKNVEVKALVSSIGSSVNHLKQFLRILKPKYLVTYESEKYAGTTTRHTDLFIKWSENSLTKDNIFPVKLDPFTTRKETELGDYLYLPIKTYSSGMKFRLAFFTSLYIESDILLLDEWIATADQKLRDKVDKLILDRIAKSKITFIASHNLDRLKKICNKIIFFEKGEISKIT